MAVPAIAVSRKWVTLGSNITLLLLTLVGVATEGLGPGGGGAGAAGPTRVDPEDPLAVAVEAAAALAYIMNEAACSSHF